jgi:ABC-2 type transport system ATP-binding protein
MSQLALDAAGVRKIYPGKIEVEALRGIDLKVISGEFMALLGPNGAGKSTFLGILTGLVGKTAGKIQVYGHDLDSDPNSAKSCIGLVPQEFNFNIFEECLNIVLFQAGYFGIRTAAALPVATKLFKDLELWDKRNQPARNLSGGMKRRLMLARALVTQPKMLILDEPSAGLDIELRRHLWTYLRELNASGTTILLTTHYLEEAEMLCRRVAIIDEGKILRDCPIRELLHESSQQVFQLEGQHSGDQTGLEHPAFQLKELPGEQADSKNWELRVPAGMSLNEVFAELTQSGYRISNLTQQSGRLEDLFIELVTKSEKQEAK